MKQLPALDPVQADVRRAPAPARGAVLPHADPRGPDLAGKGAILRREQNHAGQGRRIPARYDGMKAPQSPFTHFRNYERKFYSLLIVL